MRTTSIRAQDCAARPAATIWEVTPRATTMDTSTAGPTTPAAKTVQGKQQQPSHSVCIYGNCRESSMARLRGLNQSRATRCCATCCPWCGGEDKIHSHSFRASWCAPAGPLHNVKENSRPEYQSVTLCTFAYFYRFLATVPISSRYASVVMC